jgi:putative phosphoribosyl transferase
MLETKKTVSIPVGQVSIEGNLTVPDNAVGIVVFAHGSGSGRFSSRNQYVAGVLNKAGIGTLLVDLLTEQEEEKDNLTAEFRFNIDLISQRTIGAANWLLKNLEKNLSLGFFGASTGAAAAIIAATRFSKQTKAVVSRGGRPDLAMTYLAEVKAPTLFIVGGDDFEVIELNKQAMEQIRVEKRLEIIEGATHLFEEQGKLEQVAKLSAEWFFDHFKK